MNLDSQAAETMLEELVGPLEVGAQASLGGRPVAALERAPARDDEELPLDADEQARRHACVELLHAELGLERLAQDAREARHDLQLLGAQRRRFLDDSCERGEARAAHAAAVGDVLPPQRDEDRFVRLPLADGSDERRLASGNLVVEEVLFAT